MYAARQPTFFHFAMIRLLRKPQQTFTEHITIYVTLKQPHNSTHKANKTRSNCWISWLMGMHSPSRYRAECCVIGISWFMLVYYAFVWPYRNLINLSYRTRPLASEVVRTYIRQRHCPSWTSFFLPYKFVQDDLFGEKHFNFPVDGVNYHVLRIGCYPYVKYHCTSRPVQNLGPENQLFKFFTILNLGIPCLLYGLAARFLIRHTDFVTLPDHKTPIPIHFLILEDHT